MPARLEVILDLRQYALQVHDVLEAILGDDIVDFSFGHVTQVLAAKFDDVPEIPVVTLDILVGEIDACGVQVQSDDMPGA